jgi:hypothetical protein
MPDSEMSVFIIFAPAILEPLGLRLSMTADETSAIGSCLELNLGDEIEATYKGVLVHRGRVTDLAPDHNLFWIMDKLRGGRRLLELIELEVIRIQDVAGDPATNEAA